MQCLWYTNTCNNYACTINCTHTYVYACIKNKLTERNITPPNSQSVYVYIVWNGFYAYVESARFSIRKLVKYVQYLRSGSVAVSYDIISTHLCSILFHAGDSPHSIPPVTCMCSAGPCAVLVRVPVVLQVWGRVVCLSCLLGPPSRGPSGHSWGTAPLQWSWHESGSQGACQVEGRAGRMERPEKETEAI